MDQGKDSPWNVVKELLSHILPPSQNRGWGPVLHSPLDNVLAPFTHQRKGTKKQPLRRLLALYGPSKCPVPRRCLSSGFRGSVSLYGACIKKGVKSWTEQPI